MKFDELRGNSTVEWLGCYILMKFERQIIGHVTYPSLMFDVPTP